MPPQSSVQSPRAAREALPAYALAATVILALIAYLPFVAVPFLPTKAYLLALGAIITLALYILVRLSRGNLVLPPLPLVGALLLPALAYLLSAALSGASFTGAFWGTSLESDTAGFMLACAALGLLAALTLRRSGEYRAFIAWIGAALGLLAVIQVLVLVVGRLAPGVVTPTFSLAGSQGDVALLLGLGLVGGLLALRSLSLAPRVRLAILVLGVFALFSLAVLGSSLAWILVAIVALGLFVEAVMKRRPGGEGGDMESTYVESAPASSAERPLVAPLVVLALALFFIIGSNLGTALASAFHANVLSVRPSWQSTLTVIRKTYATAPIFGTGPDSFGADWLAYRNAALNTTDFWNIDFTSGIGFVPSSLATTGLVGTLAWLLFFALFAFFGIRMLVLYTPEDEWTSFAALASFVAMVFLFAADIFSVPGPIVIALSFVMAGVFASTMRFSAAAKGSLGVIFSRSPRLGFVIVFALTLLLLGSVAAAYGLIEHYAATSELALAQTALSDGNLNAAGTAAAASLSFASSPAAYQAEALVAGSRLSAILASTTIPTASAEQSFQAALSSGISAALTATQLQPDNYQNWIALGNLYASAVPLNITGAYTSAKAAYQKAEALDPTNAQIPYVMAQLDIANKDTASAETDLKAAITLKENYVDAIVLLSQLEVSTGDLQDALVASEAAAYFSPTDPNILFQLGLLEAASGSMSNAIQALSASVAADPQFANARYFLAAAYADEKDYTDALAQLQAIAALSSSNASAVASAETELAAGKNPFPANLLSASSTPVSQ